MSNIKLKDHNWATDGVYDTTLAKSQKTINSDVNTKIGSTTMSTTDTTLTGAIQEIWDKGVILKGTINSAGYDFNNSVTPGTWQVSSRDDYVNAPQKWGYLVVTRHGTAGSVMQHWYITDRLYIRLRSKTSSADNWYAWQEVATPAGALKKYAGLDAGNYSTLIADGTDLNAVNTVGTYYCPAASNSDTYTSCPVSAAFILHVVKISNSATRLEQILISNKASSNIWYRYYGGSSWSWWRRLSYPVKVVTSKTFTGSVSSQAALTTTDSEIHTTTYSIKEEYGDPSQVTGDVTWTTVEGNINVTGTFTSTGTTITFYLMDSF